jgi:hypothetical protein
VYCATERSVDGDHIFARQFFLERHRQNLPKVPACKKCNNEKSKLEHYLSALLPFGGRQESATENLSSNVPKRLENNLRLARTLESERTKVWSYQEGIYVQTMALPIVPGTLEALFTFIVKGLLWFHWKTILSADDFVQVVVLTKQGEKLFDEKFMRLRYRNRVVDDFGQGTFSYVGSQGVDKPQISVWLMSAFGGIIFTGDSTTLNESSSKIGIITGSKQVIKRAALRAKFCL